VCCPGLNWALLPPSNPNVYAYYVPFLEQKIMKYFWMLIFFVVLVWSGINPKDQFTWFLEVLPAMIGMVILAVTYKSFRLTPILYFFILLHCLVLMVGGHYTYAEVPFFDGLLGYERNNYDKVGHFFQGFVPALLIREILIRKSVVNGNHWRNVIIVSVCLAFSAFYELIEWWVALATGDDAEAFLGTQGYVWDTQSDMGLALLGAILSLLVLSFLHDKQLKNLIRPEGVAD
jgi:putative membrane protein